MISPVALAKELSQIDWDFKGGWTQQGLHALHWYPGTFIPQVASNLVRLLTRPGDLVLDPFCGCGTTLLESIRLGRPAIGIDSNTLGILVSQVKSTEFSIRGLQRDLDAIQETAVASLFGKTHGTIEANPELSPWFSPATLRALTRLWQIIQSTVGSIEHRRFFQVCLSHVLRTSCSQENHWGWIADNVAPKARRDHDAYALFARHAQNMVRELERMYQEIKTGQLSSLDVLRNSRALLADCRQPLPIPTADAVVTSPPYPCVIDYTRAQRLSFEFFGWNRDEGEEVEIGARWKRFRKRQIDEYVQDLARAFANINAVLRHGGLVGLVIDAVRRTRRDLPKPPPVDIPEILKRTFGYVNVGDTQVRKLSSQRLLDRKGSRNQEFIVVLQKPA